MILLFTALFLPCCKLTRDSSQVSVTNPIPANDLYPEVVDLKLTYIDGSIATCSGTFITERRVITAAHCLIDEKNRPVLEVYFVDNQGYHHFGNPFPSRAHRVKDHPSLRVPTDLGLLEFEEDVAPAIAKVATSAPEKGDELILVGFGNTDQLKNTGAGKKSLGVNQVSKVDGNTSYLVGYSSAKVNGVDPGMFSVSGHGDSGGAIFNRKGELVSVMSAGKNINEADDVGNPKALSFAVNIAHPKSQKLLKAIHTEICTGRPPAAGGCLGGICSIQ